MTYYNRLVAIRRRAGIERLGQDLGRFIWRIELKIRAERGKIYR